MKNSTIIFIITLFTLFSCKKEINTFALSGKVKGNYTGYLFIDYEGKTDSVLIENGKYKFRGSVNHPASAYLSLSDPSYPEKELYLENTKIRADFYLKKEHKKSFEIWKIGFDTIMGSHTQDLDYAFNQYEEKHKNDSDWNQKLYAKIAKITYRNPESDLSFSLLSRVSFDSILRPKQLQNLYENVDEKYQDKASLNKLKNRIYPENQIQIGDQFPNFSLPDSKGKLINTKDFGNELLFVNFWASWCAPCREEFKDLKPLSKEFSKDFKVIAISFDTDEKRWYDAIEKDNLEWINLIDKESFKGNLAKKYNIYSIPSNLLINKERKIIALNMMPSELREHLKTL